jgi:hypothetical protein
VTGYEEESTNHQDLSAFLARERPDVKAPKTFNFPSLDNGTDSQAADEAGFVLSPPVMRIF